MRIVIVMPPLESVDAANDACAQIALAACERNHALYHCGPGGISARDGRIDFAVRPLNVRRDGDRIVLSAETPEVRDDEAVDLVLLWNRTPVDERALCDTWLLDLLPKRIPVVNSPRGVRAVDDHLWICRFPALMPATLISADLGRFLAFLAEHHTVTIRPTSGPRCVRHIDPNHADPAAAFEACSVQGTHQVVIQHHLAATGAQAKRLVLLDGDILGAARFPGADAADVRDPQPCDLVEDDLRIVARIGPHLRDLGLSFVGIVVVAGKLVEIEAAPPSCLKAIMALGDDRLDYRVIDRLETIVRKCRASEHHP